ncbi:M66 family metalloprotease [Vibrio cholerae]|uniref:M66 family metalloprotease n=1 Tax=Vibrio cholerae TaxID=666 RepID=UPI0030810BBB
MQTVFYLSALSVAISGCLSETDKQPQTPQAIPPSISAIEPIEITPGQSSELILNVTGGTNQSLNFELINGPSWVRIDPKSGQLSIAPPPYTQGEFIIQLSVSNGYSSSITEIKIIVDKKTFNITSKVIGDGEILPQTLTLNSGDRAVFTIKHHNDQKLKSISGCQGQLYGNKYIIENAIEDCTIQAKFENIVPEPAIAFNTNDFPNDLSGNLPASVLFAQNHIIPANRYIDGDVNQHLIGERTTLVMIKPKDKLDESVPFTVTAYNDYGQRLGTLPLNRPYQFPRPSGVNSNISITEQDFAIDDNQLQSIDTATVASQGSQGNTSYLNAELLKSAQGVKLHSTQWLRLHKLYLDFNPEFDGKSLIVIADSPYTTDVKFASGRSSDKHDRYLGINQGQKVTFINRQGHWFIKDDVELYSLTYAHGYWSATLPAEWLKPGLNLVFNHGDQQGELHQIKVGAPTVAYINTIDIGMLTPRRDTFEFMKDEELPREFYQTLPISKLIVSRYEGITFDEIMMPDGTLFTEYATGLGGWHEGNMRADIAKSLISTGINGANYGINASAGPAQNAYSHLALMLTAHTSVGRYEYKMVGNTQQKGPWNIVHGGSGGGGIITLESTVGNEMSHEGGHGFELGHSEGHDMSIHRPADQKGSTWGWDSDKNVMIPNFFARKTNQEVCIGAENAPNRVCVEAWRGHRFGTDAMFGGEGSMYPDNRYTMYTPYSSAKIQRVMEKRMVFSEESPTGFAKWNPETESMEPFVHKVQIKNERNIGGGQLASQQNTAEYLKQQFGTVSAINITTSDGNWLAKVVLPEANEVPSGSVIKLNHQASWSTTYVVNGTEIVNPKNKIFRTNGGQWVETEDTGVWIEKRPEYFGTAVTTLLGYYDPEGKLPSYAYPALQGSRGYVYADDSQSIQPTDCRLEVTIESGAVKQYWLPNQRLAANKMNKYHVNIAQQEKPTEVAVLCGNEERVRKNLNR